MTLLKNLLNNKNKLSILDDRGESPLDKKSNLDCVGKQSSEI
jgi:hypothetical protein